MTVSARLRWISRTSFGRIALVLVAFATSGCPADNHVGRPCEVGTMSLGGGSGQVVIVASPALECPSHVCLLGGAGIPQGTGALCTAGCETDSDCDDAESGPKGDPSDQRCENGFACMWPTTVGSFACQKLCVCRDFVSEPPGGLTKPAACGN